MKTITLTDAQVILIRQSLEDMNALDQSVLKHMTDEPLERAATEITIEDRNDLIRLFK